MVLPQKKLTNNKFNKCVEVSVRLHLMWRVWKPQLKVQWTTIVHVMNGRNIVPILHMHANAINYFVQISGKKDETPIFIHRSHANARWAPPEDMQILSWKLH